ncbi:hypothetical protein P7K49_008588 [Saguinus oedipus]|uniref:Laminin EGF-like domain-containing protein n=1 Tax=Saguinus oedipus TaxID=9490 RepID=A0ABQ9W1Q3_SAGOE|nr:hypothetical protein P7K49_008588 [Saguinus oedipus]
MVDGPSENQLRTTLPCVNLGDHAVREGYFGQPSVPGGSCQPCQCNDNLDFSIPGSCDSLSGSCLICKPGTTGRYCELCADGYFGDAVDAKNCQPCLCNANGSFSEICHGQTGQCECRANVQGQRCDECKSLNMPVVLLSVWQAASDSSMRADRFVLAVSHKYIAFLIKTVKQKQAFLRCQTGLTPNMWRDPEKRFCVLCDCDPAGSVSPQCDITGRCVCKSGFTGKQCNLSRQVHQQEEQPRRAQRVLGSPQRWAIGGSSGCPRGAYRTPAPVIPEALHGSCLCMLCSVCCD